MLNTSVRNLICHNLSNEMKDHNNWYVKVLSNRKMNCSLLETVFSGGIKLNIPDNCVYLLLTGTVNQSVSIRIKILFSFECRFYTSKRRKIPSGINLTIKK